MSAYDTKTEMVYMRKQFQPGNMSNYDVQLFKMGDSYTLVWLNKGGSGGTAFRWWADINIHTEYLQEKMGIGEGDAIGLSLFLISEGIPVGLPKSWPMGLSNHKEEEWLVKVAEVNDARV
mgnify:CR=1 FL=1